MRISFAVMRPVSTPCPWCQSNRHFEITAPAANGADLFPALPSRLRVTFDLAAGGMTFEWVQGDGSVAARGRLVSDASGFGWVVLRWQMESENLGCPDSCNAHSSSVRALLRRIQNLRPLCDERPRIGLLSDLDLGPARSGEWFPLEVPPDEDFWKWLGREVIQFARMIASRLAADGDPGLRGRVALRLLAGARLGVTPKPEDLLPQGALYQPVAGLLSLRVTFNQVKGFCEFVWTRPTTALSWRRGASVSRVWTSSLGKPSRHLGRRRLWSARIVGRQSGFNWVSGSSGSAPIATRSRARGSDSSRVSGIPSTSRNLPLPHRNPPSLGSRII